MSEFFGSLWWMLVTLGLLVTFHEFGHFWVARRLGVKVLRFSVGFGKALWSRVGRDSTEYVIAAIPLGGYVKFLDERELEEAVDAEELKGAFNRQSVWTRIAVTAAGPMANLIFAVAAFWLMLVIGKPDYQAIVGRVDGIAATAGFAAGDRITGVDAQRIDNWSDVSMALLRGAMEHRALTLTVIDKGGTERTRALPLDRLPSDGDDADSFRAIGLAPRHWQVPAVVGELSKDGAAMSAGIRSGDRILSIDGQAVQDFADVPPLIQKRAAANHALTVTVQRAGETIDVTVQPKLGDNGKGKEVWLIGFSPAKVPAAPHDAVLRYGPLRAVPEALAATWSGVRDTFDLIGKMLSGAASTSPMRRSRPSSAQARLAPAMPPPMMSRS